VVKCVLKIFKEFHPVLRLVGSGHLPVAVVVHAPQEEVAVAAVHGQLPGAVVVEAVQDPVAEDPDNSNI
jgi:hypothetical protein